jgi:hypothetical protein
MHSSIDDYSTYEGANKYEHWTLVDGYQHGLKYKEQIYAGYFTYSHQWKRLSIKAGLRAEHRRTGVAHLELLLSTRAEA